MRIDELYETKKQKRQNKIEEVKNGIRMREDAKQDIGRSYKEM